MAQPLAELHVPGANNEAGTTDDRRTAENENESCQVPHEPARGESNAKQKRTPYQQLAADMAQPLADLHVPGANNEAGTTDDRRTAENEMKVVKDLANERTTYQQQRMQRTWLNL
ncbi:hypothetical protein OS493_023994 [Desmophyllum pertusum]|uniref:Uncharacterized protein n=1 Tax=Desmophyllum pertusum TaxID=174260 RepID=A0A9X0A002_9CNID|nr:hypothetical protein OS493_023994 [Desmophyllum pertusum]